MRLDDLDALKVWGEVCGLDVTIQEADFGILGKMAFIGFSGGNTCWSLYWSGGRLWLAYLPDPSRECVEGWTVEVGSVVEAMAKIITDAEE